MCTRRALGRLWAGGHRRTAQVLSWGPCGSSLGLRFPTWVSPAEPGAPWTSSYPHGAPLLWAAKRPVVRGGPGTAWVCGGLSALGRLGMGVDGEVGVPAPLLFSSSGAREGGGRQGESPGTLCWQDGVCLRLLRCWVQAPRSQACSPHGAMRESSASPARPWGCAGGGTRDRLCRLGWESWVRPEVQETLSRSRGQHVRWGHCSVPAGLGSRPETPCPFVPSAGRSCCPAVPFAPQVPAPWAGGGGVGILLGSTAWAAAGRGRLGPVNALGAHVGRCSLPLSFPLSFRGAAC